MEWNNVLLGKAINLDIVFTRMFSTATDSQTIETSVNLSCILEPPNQQNLLTLMETGLMPGGSLSEQPNSSFHTGKGNSRSIPNMSPLILPPSTRAPTGKFSTSTKQSGSGSDLSTMALSTSSANSDISKLATCMDTALAKAANPPSRKCLR